MSMPPIPKIGYQTSYAQLVNKTETISCIVPARNEAGNLPQLIDKILRVPEIYEILIVEGGSTDDTWRIASNLKLNYPKKVRCLQQTGNGKFDAVLLGAREAKGSLILIWDADGTVPLTDTLRIIECGISMGGMVTGDRLLGKMEPGSMRFLNWLGNWFFSGLFAFLLFQKPIDLLCGTKLLPKEVLLSIPNRMIQLDPFGDFAMILHAKRSGYKIVSLPVAYDAREFGKTNIKRWSSGIQLLRFVGHAVLSGVSKSFTLSSKTE